MRLHLTRQVPERPVPPAWSGGECYAAVEEAIGQRSSPCSVSADTARVLARVIVEERRSRVLEFGAGMSSRILAAALEEVGGGRLTSVEEHPAWCRGTLRRWLLTYPELSVVANDPSIGRGLAILRWEESARRRAGLAGSAGLVERWASGVHEAVRNVRTIRKHEKRRYHRGLERR